jgi:hypothetical protein
MKQLAILKATCDTIPIVFVGKGNNSTEAQKDGFAQLRRFRESLTAQHKAVCVQQKRIFRFPVITIIETTFPLTSASK